MKRHNGQHSKRRLQKYIEELTSLAKNMSPEIEILETRIPGYEELDAWIDIIVPDENEEEISEILSERRSEISYKSGYHIGLGITERSHYEAVHAKRNGNAKMPLHSTMMAVFF